MKDKLLTYFKKFIKSKKAVILSILLLIMVILVIRHIYNKDKGYFLPEYERCDISSILTSSSISSEDYDMIFRHTGVSPKVADEIISSGDTDLLLKLNNLYHTNPEYKKVYIAYPVTVEERLKDGITPLVNLKKGDILVTFNTHTLDWRHGHSAIVLDDEGKRILEHASIGNTSCITSAKNWGTYPSFVILRYPDYNIASKAADYAAEHLVDIDYSIFAGIITKDKSKKDTVDTSHCSHIVWQSYKAVGVDIDYDGGPIVTPHDIAMSDKLKVLQIFGMDTSDYTDRLYR